MEPVFNQLLGLLGAFWWPFCRAMAVFSAAPVLGENMTPVTVRILLSLVLAVILMPTAQTAVAIDPFSLHGIVATMEQALIGFVIGLAFHLTMSTIMVLGFIVSSQMGLAMAVMNDPMNGTSSDVISTMLYMMCILVFFSIDGHLVVTGVLAASFKAFPVGAGIAALSLKTLPLAIAWVFSAALLLAVPVVFSTIVVQFGAGLLNRVAPSLNLFSLGFAVVTVFGLFMLTQVVRFVPEHYIRMTGQVLDLIHRGLKAA
ncbi:flagellar biosynthetic protein FliR [Aquincola sp. MAHUQ-54]|uniref:Flagellar biosynthetic protein FliR n=1 Tax=Aquincola agrisoli TaxID=3119538 RepID=A0AAW9QJF1_9BURK